MFIFFHLIQNIYIEQFWTPFCDFKLAVADVFTPPPTYPTPDRPTLPNYKPDGKLGKADQGCTLPVWGG